MEDKSKLMPIDIIILEELVNEKLKATTNEITIMNFTCILQRLSWECHLAWKREQVSLGKIIAAHCKDHTIMTDQERGETIRYESKSGYTLIGKVEGKNYWPVAMIVDGVEYKYNRETRTFEAPPKTTPSQSTLDSREEV